ncbi:hypothetical protein QFC19_009017 [Naganishia cerealis]|uniref:Uncharacterized protein n=1 Tax=Naganishia cerealis TaxID=610337 RepID=A0ACC2UXZ6_9TREE|nr:hypothetical protein QFC19_009017 [Naganishia cerealis]
MPPKKVFKPAKRPAPVLAETSTPNEAGAHESEVPPAREAEGSGTGESTTAMHIDPALEAIERTDPVSEAPPTTTTTTTTTTAARSGGTTARGIGASMRRGEGTAAGSGIAQGEARGQETRPKVVFKPTVPVRKVKQE